MKISIVTPNLNLGHYLASTIESVLVNLRPGDEYFIVDGGSSDGSQEVIRSYEKRITAWTSEPDRSYGDALRKGFDRATGEVLCWINSGDLLLPGAFDAARQAFAETDAGLIFGDDFYIDENDQVLQYSRGYVKDLKHYMLYGGWTPLQDACFWRSDLYRKVGGINLELRFASDFALFLRMSSMGKIHYVPKAFSAFRRHPGQKSIAGSAKYEAERQRVRKHMVEEISQDSRLHQVLRRSWYWTAVRWRARISQKLWRRPDLAGRSIHELACDVYWPKPAPHKL